ncbi:Transcription factor Sox-2 [Linnemannia exigua]|uniref:Transcription factor Sox-2 n=1 Tax=Linnemannia exigua TaxID=604196 RepID=A0AAD4H4R6_9FUNG|nr:Transcription factor Sox-2 [Linnemannia exigua]
MKSLISPNYNGTTGTDNTPKPSNKLTSTALSASRPAKIPRPANSFLIYRKEHAIKYSGLVAPKLSAILAVAWKNEPPERVKYYADLAEKEKKKHALKYPDYKFTPVKRGTGKRARALQAAAAQAAKEAAMSRPVQAPTLKRSKVHMSIAPRKKSSNARSVDVSALITPSPSPSAQCSPSPPPESERTTPANRPKRVIQRPERFSPCGYRERPSLSVSNKSSGTPDSESCSASVETHSSPLFFSSYSDRTSLRMSTSSYSSRINKTSASSRSRKSSASIRSLKSTSRSSYSREDESDTCVEYDDIDFSDASLSSGGEDDGSDDSDYEDKRMTSTRLTGGKKVPQADCTAPSCPKTPFFQSEDPLFYDTTFASPYTLENFEPECLPREDYQWPAAALVGSFSVLATPPHIDLSPLLFSEYMYPTPAFEDPIIDFAEYANFDQDGCYGNMTTVMAKSKGDDKLVANDGICSSESGTRGGYTFPLAVDTLSASLPTFPAESTIPLSLLSPTTGTAHAMESMSLSSVASSNFQG